MALRQKSEGPLDDDSALLLMAREVLGGPADDGKSSYKVALNICERCGRATQDARGEVVAVDDAIVEMTCCDAQHIGRVATSPTHVGANDAVETHMGAHAAADETHMETPDGGGEPRAGVNTAAHETHVGVNDSAAQRRSGARDANGETHDHLVIGGDADVELESVRSVRERTFERRDRIFDFELRRATSDPKAT